jgi:putative ABC transport system permease protein
MSSFLSELARSFRSLALTPGATFTAAMALGLAMAANGLVFSLVHGVLLRPLPYREPERLVMVWSTQAGRGAERSSVSAPDFIDFRDRTDAFESLAAMRLSSFAVGAAEPEQANGAMVSANFFDLLGLAPQLGRYFVSSEERAAQERLVVLSEPFWRRAFAGDPGVLGREVLIDGRARTVVGIAPAVLRLPGKVDLWLPASFEAAGAPRGGRYWLVVGRLRRGISLPAAQQQLHRVAESLAQEYPETHRGWSAAIVALHEQMIEPARPALRVLFAAVWTLLLIAGVNTANILLLRGLHRQGELALRVVLGGGAGDLARLLFCESLALALLAGLGGMVVETWGTQIVRRYAAGVFPRGDEVTIDSRVVLYNLGLVVLAGACCALLPLVHALRQRAGAVLQGDSRLAGRRLQGLVVVAQVGASLALLVTVLLLAKSFHRLRSTDPGFDTAGVVSAKLTLSASRYGEARTRGDYYSRVLEQVEALPGVESAALASELPLSGSTRTSSFSIEEAVPPQTGERPAADVHAVSPSYFAVMGIRLLDGRTFAAADAARQGVAVINRVAQRQFWPEGDPIGRRLSIGGPREDDLYGGPLSREILGVVADVRHHGLGEAARPQIYIPLEQDLPLAATLVVRSRAGFDRLAGPLRQAALAIDREQPLGTLQTLESLVSSSLQQRRLQLVLLGGFAALSLLLTASGIYAVMSYVALRRVREIGLRFALGAQRRAILALLLKQSLRLTLLGLVVGLALSWGSTRLLEHALYQVRPADLAVYLAATLLVLVTALLAVLVPASRALRVDPALALREP